VAARGVRWLNERRRGVIAITYPGGQVVRVPVGYAVLEASRSARIPHASICGGRGRCTTCRIRILRGADSLPEPQPSEASALARLRAGPNVRLACQLRPRKDVTVLPLLPADILAGDPARDRDAASMERFVAIMFVDIRRSTALFESRLPYDAIFLLNHFFDAVAGAITIAGGAPNQFVGDGVMAIFGMRTTPKQACADAIAAAELIRARLDEMNRTLANELPAPLAIGIGVHAGNAILGEIGYGDRFLLTAIGDTVHVAARLQDLTKEYACELILSEIVVDTSGESVVTQSQHDVQVRGREAPVRIHVVAGAPA
jgi:adenylate cyclase